MDDLKLNEFKMDDLKSILEKCSLEQIKELKEQLKVKQTERQNRMKELLNELRTTLKPICSQDEIDTFICGLTEMFIQN